MTKVYRITPTEKMAGICYGSMLVSAMTESQAKDTFYDMYGDIYITAEEVRDLVYGGSETVIENNIVFTHNYIESLVW